MCFALCLLIAGAAFGATNLLKGGEAPPSSDNETVSSNEGFFQEDRGQNEEVSPIPGPVNSVDSISVDVAAKNVVVMNADTNTLLYQKNSTDKIAPASTAKVIGLKTGVSGLAGACIVSAAIINGETYICVVMGSTKDARFQDSIAIYDKIKTQ